jgi:hypothetical protein
MFKELGKTSLLSMGILADHGCKIHLQRDSAIITKDDYTWRHVLTLLHLRGAGSLAALF